ncbi:MAG TPA: hypothetical protein PKN44_10105 [Bacteroidales bacterium]|nr:hypothetical protein [Bacteroidales bacterium]
MISIKINGNALELPDDFSLSLNAKSPVFNEMGSYTYPFKVKYSPRNAALLKFKNRPQNTGSIYEEFDAELYYNNLLWMRGTLKVKIANSTTFDCVFYPGEGEFYYQAKNRNLQDFDYGGQHFNDDQEAINWINASVMKVYPECPIGFPMVFNNNYYEDQETGEMQYFNFYYVSDDNLHLLNTNNGRTIIVPMMYFRYVLDKLFEGMGYDFTDLAFTSDPAYNSLVLYNSVNCNNGEGGFFPYQINDLLFNYHVPRLKLNDFFSGLEKYLGLCFFVNAKQKSVTLKTLNDILSDPNSIDFSKNIVSLSVEPEDKINGFKLAMELDDDDAFKTQTENEEELSKHLKGSVETVNDLPSWPIAEDQEIRYVIDSGEYYKMIWKVWYPIDTPAVEMKTQYYYRDPKESISSKFSTLIMGGNDMYCNCLNTRENFQEITPRLFFSLYGYYGEHLLARGYNYNPTAGSLFFNGLEGLFIQRWKNFLDFKMRTKLVKVVRYCDFLELRDLDFSRKYSINGVHYLIKDYQVTIKKNGLSSTTFSLYPVL